MQGTINGNLIENKNIIKTSFHHTSDLVFRDIKFGTEYDKTAVIVFLEGLVDSETLQNSVVVPLIEFLRQSDSNSDENHINRIAYTVLTNINVSTTKYFKELINSLLEGKAVLLLNGSTECIITDTTRWQERSLEESKGEKAAFGMIYGFTEKAQTNINILRGIIKTEDLCVEKMTFGTVSNTNVNLIFLDNIVDKALLRKVRKRLKTDVKYILQGRVIQEAIEGNPKSIFPLSKLTERPDVTASALYEGRVIVIIDGNPQVMVFPALLNDFLQSPDEYFTNFGQISMRLVRLLAFLSTIFIPSIFVALGYHGKEYLSDKEYEILISKDEYIPIILEVLILIILFRIILDSTLRVPSGFIVLVAILGPIVVGETAVVGKLIHPVSLIAIAFTYLASTLFGDKGLSTATSSLRIIFIFIAYFFSYEGLMIGFTILILYLVSLRSVGVPYLSPFIPFKLEEMKDALYRGDLEKLINSKHRYLYNKK
ncbi:hypothetical protein AWM68_14575 [Fictibacillus phosphorivorans]|uniref:Uncharacterized protein n=1 Tax=Fictibacillus phosphorivorans TaxID=1221500 RepID=A0A165N226_9BACL|nr:spore germination protein [Fictibacillus phosphorivorans]KZE64310.1 hypothetical protein AWM68_14575 [Fictibacillus phosphorivorans]